ncbi:MAG TPA: DUF3445 domain-containing protein [Devosia sp.]|nr:DUF3445 domain-containing protein [Devosia sp.]
MSSPSTFDGTQRLFQIGLKPLDFNEWIDTDDHILRYLDEKLRLEADHPHETFAAEPGTEAAQQETLALLLAHLLQRFPDIYHRVGTTMSVAGRPVALEGAKPLRIAAHLVQEDLVLMRRGDAGWRLAAGSLNFPSSWRLREKFGRPIHEIHAPVPGFGAGTRNAELIARMFDSLKPAIGVTRWNWSIYPEADLYHPASGVGGLRFAGGLENAFLRVERQTLRKLPASGDILFTIRIYVNPLAQIARQPNGAVIASGLSEQLHGLDADQLAYKGLTAARDQLLQRLGAISAG